MRAAAPRGGGGPEGRAVRREGQGHRVERRLHVTEVVDHGGAPGGGVRLGELPRQHEGAAGPAPPVRLHRVREAGGLQVLAGPPVALDVGQPPAEAVLDQGGVVPPLAEVPVHRVGPVQRPHLAGRHHVVEQPAVRHALDAELAVRQARPGVRERVLTGQALVLPRAVHVVLVVGGRGDDVRAVVERRPGRGGRQPRAARVEAGDLVPQRRERRGPVLVQGHAVQVQLVAPAPQQQARVVGARRDDHGGLRAQHRDERVVGRRGALHAGRRLRELLPDQQPGAVARVVEVLGLDQPAAPHAQQHGAGVRGQPHEVPQSLGPHRAVLGVGGRPVPAEQRHPRPVDLRRVRERPRRCSLVRDQTRRAEPGGPPPRLPAGRRPDVHRVGGGHPEAPRPPERRPRHPDLPRDRPPVAAAGQGHPAGRHHGAGGVPDLDVQHCRAVARHLRRARQPDDAVLPVEVRADGQLRQVHPVDHHARRPPQPLVREPRAEVPALVHARPVHPDPLRPADLRLVRRDRVDHDGQPVRTGRRRRGGHLGPQPVVEAVDPPDRRTVPEQRPGRVHAVQLDDHPLPRAALREVHGAAEHPGPRAGPLGGAAATAPVRVGQLPRARQVRHHGPRDGRAPPARRRGGRSGGVRGVVQRPDPAVDVPLPRVAQCLPQQPPGTVEVHDPRGRVVRGQGIWHRCHMRTKPHRPGARQRRWPVQPPSPSPQSGAFRRTRRRRVRPNAPLDSRGPTRGAGRVRRARGARAGPRAPPGPRPTRTAGRPRRRPSPRSRTPAHRA
ncbi:hypothetical protein CHMI_02493 [Cellulomonas hominis]|nr:hypothetical protein CHMI_02493 [Cellulomonas hominis]